MKKPKQNKQRPLSYHKWCRYHEKGTRCHNQRLENSLFCEDHSPKKLRQETVTAIIKNNIETKYKYTLDEFKTFVEKEVSQMPSEILNCFEDLALMKALTQYFIDRLEEARRENDEKKINIWISKLSSHIQDVTKTAQRLWSMQQPSNNVPQIHVVAVLNQIQDFIRSNVPQDQYEMFDEKLRAIKVGVGEIKTDDEGITREDLQRMIMTIPKPDDTIDV